MDEISTLCGRIVECGRVCVVLNGLNGFFELVRVDECLKGVFYGYNDIEWWNSGV